MQPPDAGKIPDTPEGRRQWLANDKNRNPLVRNGAGSIYYNGDASNLKKLLIVVSHRSARVGNGLAHFGGLGEEEDIVPGDDLQTGVNNACREGQEEMEELLGRRPELDKAKFFFLYAAKDDKFFIENGHGFAVNARLHAYPLDDALKEELFPKGSRSRGRHESQNGHPQETDKAELVTFWSALRRMDDYHYPHEYFALWVMAAKVLKQDVIKIAAEINAEARAAVIDFEKLARKMNTTVATLEEHLGDGYKGRLQAYQATTRHTQKLRNKLCIFF